MTISREFVVSMYHGYWKCLNAADWDGCLEHFSDDCSFTNSAMNTVLEGKQELQKIAATWPPVVNVPDWHSIDGSRLVISWRERPEGEELVTPYRGVSSFLLNDEGKITDYIGTFNVQEVLRAHQS